MLPMLRFLRKRLSFSIATIVQPSKVATSGQWKMAVEHRL